MEQSLGCMARWPFPDLVDRTASDGVNSIATPFVTGDHIGSTKLLSARAATCYREKMPRNNMARNVHALHNLAAAIPFAGDYITLVPDKKMMYP